MITVTDLKKVYQQPGREVRALDGVSLSVPAGSIRRSTPAATAAAAAARAFDT